MKKLLIILLIAVSSMHAQDFEVYSEMVDPEVPDMSIRGMVLDKLNRPWLWTTDNQFYFKDQGIWHKVDLQEMEPENIQELKFLDDYRFYFTTFYKGLFYFDGEDFANFNFSNSDISSQLTIFDIDHNGKLWMSTTFNGIQTYDGNQWNYYNSFNSIFKGSSAHDIYVASDGIVWIAAFTTIYKVENGNWSAFDFLESFGDYIVMRQIIEAPNGNMFAITGNGFYKFVDNEWVHQPDLAGSSNMATASIDNSNTFWYTKQFDENLYRVDSSGVLQINQSNYPQIPTDVNQIIVMPDNVKLVKSSLRGHVTWIIDDIISSTVEKLQMSEIKIFPNPASSVLLYQSKYPVERYKIYDQSGISYLTGTSSNSEILIHNLPSGLYYINLISDAGSVTKAFIKK